MTKFMQGLRHFELGWLLTTLVLFALYMMGANEVGLRERTISDGVDGLFYLALGWGLRSGIMKVMAHLVAFVAAPAIVRATSIMPVKTWADSTTYTVTAEWPHTEFRALFWVDADGEWQHRQIPDGEFYNLR